MTYELDVREFRTPHGRSVEMAYRTDSSDWNTLNACLTEDEYGFRFRDFSGVAADIGAHIGGVTVGLAVDNPDLHVIAVEPVPGNAELLRANVARNGLGERVTVLEGAAGGRKPVTVWYGYTGNEAAEHHAFIGNSSLAYDSGSDVQHETVVYPNPWTLSRLAEFGDISLVKIDCEGGEYVILKDPIARKVPFIVGEWHNVRGKTQRDVTKLLPAHDVVFSGPDAGPGGFMAVLHG